MEVSVYISRGATSEGEEWGLFCPFLIIQKTSPDFWEKIPDCVPLWFTFSHLKCFFKGILEEEQEIFLCGAFLSYVADEMFVEVILFLETFHALKNFWLRPWEGTLNVHDKTKLNFLIVLVLWMEGIFHWK